MLKQKANDAAVKLTEEIKAINNGAAAPVGTKAQVAATAKPQAASVQTAASKSAPVPPRIPGAAFTIRRSKKKHRYYNGLIYGEYGVGKSTLAAQASQVDEMRDVLYCNIESGDSSVEHMDLDFVDITSYRQFARVHEFLRRHCMARDAYAEGAPGAKEELLKLERLFKQDPDITEPVLYRTVILDTLTEVQKYCMYQLLGITVGEFALDMEPDNPQFAEWGRSAEMIRLLVRSFRDLPINVIFVAAKQSEQDERKRYHYKPALPGKLADEVQGFLDFVGYYVAAPATEGGEIQRRLFLTPGQTYQAKNRFPDFKATFLDNPSMRDIANLWLAK